MIAVLSYITKNLGSYIKASIKEIVKVRNFLKQKEQFLSQDSDSRFKIGKDYPCLLDATVTTTFDAHYLYHIAWACRKVKQISPAKHVDISSSLYFCTTVSAIVPTEFYDYRPARINLSGLDCLKANLVALPFADNSIESLSCMHVVEHIGLGRYGDSIDYDSDLKAFSELKRVVSVKGHLLIVVPICSVPEIEFNAHRKYSFQQLLSYFSNFELIEHALICDNSDFVLNPDPPLYAQQNYGCGCFWFQKKA